MSSPAPPAAPARLVTIPVSHFCEKARWALDRAGIAYREECHVPALHRVAAYRAGGRGTVPVLVDASGVWPDSTDILRHVDASLPEPRRLYPDDSALRREVEQLEDLYDETLGPDARRYVYFHLIHRPEMLAFVSAGVGSTERTLFRILLPGIRRVMTRVLKLHPEPAARSRQRIEQTFSDVEARLADGRAFLLGQRFTAADLAFAALAAPVLAPPEYGASLPPVEQLPEPLRSEVAAWRSRPAGQFALRLYREQRRARS